MELDLAPGEEILTTVVPSSQCQIAVTNQRIILWEWKGGVEKIISVKLSDVYEVEVIEKKGPPRALIAALALSIVGAAFLPWLVQSLANWGEGLRLYRLILGLLGFGSLVWGLFLIGRYLRGALFPDLVLVFRGSPGLQVELGRNFSRRITDMVRLVQQLKQQADKA